LFWTRGGIPEKQGIRPHRIGQLNKVNVSIHYTKTPSRKKFGYKKTKILSDALLDENHQP
jgi:hypothetical protein